MSALSEGNAQSEWLSMFGAFLIVGVTVGLTAFFMIGEFASGEGAQLLAGIIVLIVFFVTALIGPVIATVTGLSRNSSSSIVTDAGGTALASFVGYLLMLLIVALFISLQFSGGGDGGSGGDPLQLGDSIGTLIIAGFPSALAGAAARVLRSKLG